ncbi:cryptochrome/photolyase family protein [Staphylococcus chromogenes]|uniref:cryptochrome/photolyase family protein n=1 Tax=Staphylococcus chromogenes TaxID=46126 RepID=UPI00288436FF|nr:deoxyribodipyrimidine photo-lyase [Staphylococcus chromogenes]MDT0656276.1 deoxyribodipyrimidine photo-lyase [Staphylococcus chromogenes]
MNLGVILNRVFRIQSNPLFQYVEDHLEAIQQLYVIVPIEEMSDASEVKQKDYQDVVRGFIAQLHAYGITPYIVNYEDLGALEEELALSHVLMASDTMSYHHANYDFPHVKRAFQKRKIQTIGVRANHYFNPKSTLNRQGEPYKVFTSFYKANRPHIHDRRVTRYDIESIRKVAATGENRTDLSFNNAQDMEAAARKHWGSFLQEDMTQYQTLTDDITIAYVSGMSRYLAYGLMDIHEVLRDVLEGIEMEPTPYEAYLRELMFREFYYVLMVAYPETATQSFIEKYRDLPWSHHQASFEAWKQGETGYPIIDAAMKRLQRTGQMHNRLRMVVAQFLTKHLFIDWTWGEMYFKEQLIDYDNASNVHGWQWSASTGTDAVPYFRMFNPIRQSERFDAKGELIKSELPLFGNVPVKYLHDPTKNRQVLQEHYNIVIGRDYPETIVDHKASRAYVMAVFKGEHDI